MKTILAYILCISMLSFAFMPKKGVFHLIKYFGLAMYVAIMGIAVVIQDTRLSHRFLGCLILFAGLMILFILLKRIKYGLIERRFVINKVFRKRCFRRRLRQLYKTPYLGVSEVDFDIDRIPVSHFACSWFDYFKYKKILQEQGSITVVITYYPFMFGANLLYSIKEI